MYYWIVKILRILNKRLGYLIFANIDKFIPEFILQSSMCSTSSKCQVPLLFFDRLLKDHS